MKNAYIAAVASGPDGSEYGSQPQPPDHACDMPWTSQYWATSPAGGSLY